MQLTTRSYRCTYTPLDRDRIPVLNDTGVLPVIKVRAANAEDAQRRAHAKVNSPIVMVERLEGVA